ncbi:hypothetical protein SK128_020993 [Halocaridina rubra]|uniref:Uncharacterized protein n=1 Tax=Halocaridina rubra TaxID=373956 RepID=A0AAN8XDE3_HALRR
MDPPDKGLWPATYVDFPSHRAIDASITFACLDDYVIENPDDNSLQTSGTITCQQSGWKAPAWNGTLNLPCIMKCPANYVRGYGTDETCYRVSSTQVSKGLFGAVRSCLDEGATLAVNPNISYFKNLDLVQAGNYLTAHGQW